VEAERILPKAKRKKPEAFVFGLFLFIKTTLFWHIQAINKKVFLPTL
jgi:hypothetical protein